MIKIVEQNDHGFDIQKILRLFRGTENKVNDYYFDEVDGMQVLRVECDNSNAISVAHLLRKLDQLEAEGIGYKREPNGYGLYGYTYTFYKYQD